MKFEPHGLGENDPTSGNIREHLRAVKMEVGWHTGERERERAGIMLERERDSALKR